MARSSVVPDLIDALVEALAGLLPDFTVSDGFPLELHTGDYVAVGVDDPQGTSPAPSANSTIDWAGAHRAIGLNEAGEVTCAAWAWRGDADARSARDAVYVALSAIQAHLRADVSAGVDGIWSSWIAWTQLSQDQTEQGANALLIFRVGFKARL